MADDLFVMISGCSGGGKSTLLAELARRGHNVVAEPGRRIIAEVRAGGPGALPWADPAAFGARALAMSVADHRAARGLTFFDRGIVDAAVAIVATGGAWPAEAIAAHRYDAVFLVPPWPEIYVQDEDRRHGLDRALADDLRVRQAWHDAGYVAHDLPRAGVAERADLIPAALPGRA